MLFSFRTVTFRKYPLEQVLDVISTAGYDGVELCFENEDMKPSILQSSGIDKARCILKDSGLKISATSLHSDFVADKRNFEDVLRAIEITEMLGNKTLIIAPGYIQKLDKKVLHKRLEEKLRLLLTEAERRGVTLALEPEPAMIVENTEDTLEIVKALDSKNLKINFDIGHFYCAGDSIGSAIALLKEYIVHTHFEDIKDRIHRHLVPGDGDLDFRSIFKAFQDISYGGFVTIDLFDVPDPEKAAQTSISRLKPLIGNPTSN